MSKKQNTENIQEPVLEPETTNETISDASTEIAVKAETLPETPEQAEIDNEFLKMLQAQASADLENETPLLFPKIGFKDGFFTYGKDALPGPIVAGKMTPRVELDVIILGSVFEQAYYPGPYNPDDTTPPECFAISEDERVLKPHPAAKTPQSETCAGCPKFVKGSGVGAAKACKTSRRMAVVPVDVLDGASAEVARIVVPPTSLFKVKAHLIAASKATKLPSYGVITRLNLEKGERSYILKPSVAAFSEVVDAEGNKKKVVLEMKHLKMLYDLWKNNQEDLAAPYRYDETKPEQKPE